LKISQSVKEDIPALVTLINSAYRGEASRKGWTTEADLLGGERTNPNALEKIMERKNTTILKFCDEDAILKGCVYLEKKNDKMYLGMLTVSPMEQAQGIGKKLLAASEDHAARLNCSVVEMKVISVRDELINWYERHGYHKTGEVSPFIADTDFQIPKEPLEFITLEKKL
jgi:ribosomal protein S18 acetylase RimI-like enzyme